VPPGSQDQYGNLCVEDDKDIYRITFVHDYTMDLHMPRKAGGKIIR
jgi:hypothetical protein